jgi:hypothetical protein
MTASVPNYKGTGFVPVIASLKAHPRGAREVPPALQHYLDRQILSTDWYPERDFMALTECLARILERDGMRDVWTYFGKVAAERDLKGTQQQVPAARRIAKAGIYRSFAQDEEIGVSTFLARMTMLWSLYHDSGRMVVGRSPDSDRVALCRVYEYQFMTPHFTELLTAYWSEYVNMLSIRAALCFKRAVGGAEPFSEWDLTVERTPENLLALAALPVLS